MVPLWILHSSIFEIWSPSTFSTLLECRVHGKHYHMAQVKESLPSLNLQTFHTIHVIEAYTFYANRVQPLQKLNNF